ncbi:hypothetical protein Rhe02_87120 [Rhizocola hellebori]|uniref:Uncharacterized protein n=1 Tax=Rhizocola hellebori TaxID=1392758 RepID=A0A8J3VLA1_9ACTN|nr:hypothetical protein [Rhizocola hellebori]GIH10645.1 hypothetical protein Rhe02_87120 [Rhizocola hellebori]
MTTPADFILLQEKINDLLKKLDDKIDAIDRAYQKGLHYLDEAAEYLGDLVQSARRALVKLYNWAKTEINKMKADFNRVKVGGEIILTMMSWDDKWFEIRNLANGVAVKLNNPQDRLGTHWEGPAAAKYFTVVTPQMDAAKRVAAMADKTATSLQSMVTHGIAFMVALATALTVVIGGLITLIVGLAGGVTAPIGAAGLLTALGAAVALTAAFANFVAQQDTAGSALEFEATNPIGFAPGPVWPQAAAVSQDVTAHDGDAADWRPVHP